MKSFVILTLFALGTAELNSGYNYPQPEQSYTPYVSSFHQQSNGGFAPYSSIEHSLQYTHQPQVPEQTHSQSETYNKEFYSFLAPEEELEDSQALHKIQSAVQKNVRVIFIRTPENRALEHAALELAKLSTEDKTAIYVLNKQVNIGDLANRFGVLREHTNNKPEVHFVKYRTQEEAAHAQHTIQAQYDSRLPGQTQNFNEGVAPALNFVSKSVENTIDYGSNLGNYLGQTTGLNSFQPQVANPFSTELGNVYGQTTNAFNTAIPQVTVGPQVQGSISMPNFNAAYGNYQGQAVDLNGYGGNFAANAAFNTDGFKENLGYSTYENVLSNSKENPVASINSRLSTGGSSFVFPSEKQSTRTYLPPFPPLKRQKKLI